MMKTMLGTMMTLGRLLLVGLAVAGWLATAEGSNKEQRKITSTVVHGHGQGQSGNSDDIFTLCGRRLRNKLLQPSAVDNGATGHDSNFDFDDSAQRKMYLYNLITCSLMMASTTTTTTTSPATSPTEAAGNSNESFEEADESASAAAAPTTAKSRVKRNVMLNYPGPFQHFGYRTDFGKRAPAWPLPNTYQHFGYRTDFGKRWLHLPASSSKPSRSVVIRQPQHFGYRTDFGKKKRSLVTSAQRIIAVLRKGSSGYY